MRPVPSEDDYDEPVGFIDRIKASLHMGGYVDPDEEDDLDDPPARRQAPLRLNSQRVTRVSVWKSVDSMDSATQAADSLKDGHQLIVNFERAPEEVCSRVFDFICGVTYALDGVVQDLGDKVFLFAPVNCEIDVEGRESRNRFDIRDGLG